MDGSRTFPILVIATAACAAAPPSPRPAPSGPPPTLAITHVDVIPIDRPGVLRDQTVLVRGDTITTVAAAAQVAVPRGTPTVDGRGRFLIPGLFDTHVHLGTEPPEHLMLYLAHGVTTVQNMSGRPAHLELRRRVAAGEIPGPRILSTGPTTAEERVDSPDKARAHVEMVRTAGYDAIKQYGDGADHMTEETYRALIEAAHAAKLRVVGHAPRNLPFTTVLAAGQDSIDHAEEIVYTHAPLGGDVIRTMQFRRDLPPDEQRRLVGELDGLVDRAAPAIADLARAARASGLALTPTLVAFETIQRQVSPEFPRLLADPYMEYVSPLLRASWGPRLNRYRTGGWKDRLDTMNRVLSTSLQLQEALVRGLDAAGVPIMTGTDAPLPFVYPGRSLHRELELLVASGLTPAKALRAATIVPARELGVAGGVIAPGAPADLVLVARDPLVDVRHAREIVAVVRAGKAWTRAELDAGLARLAALHDPMEADVAAIVAGIETDDPVGIVAAYRAVARPDERLAKFVENAINGVGYARLAAGRRDDAIAVFELNTQAFPGAFNTWDSLAEAHMTAGHHELAIQYYRKSLELEPKNDNATKMIEKIQGEQKQKKAPAPPARRKRR